MKIDRTIWNDGTKSSDDLALALIMKAQNNNHTKFEYIRNLRDREIVKVCIKTFTRLVANYKKTAKNLLKRYEQTIKLARPSHELIIAHQEILLCAKFYEEEITIYKDIRNEFRSYLWAGQFLDFFFFGKERAEKDLYDMRGKKHECDS